MRLGPEQHSRTTEALGANSDDVSVWELEGKRHALANPLENGDRCGCRRRLF